jgi:hypothetical protein
VSAVLHEAFADHAADAFGTAGYEDDLALQGVLVNKLEEVWGYWVLTLTSKRFELSILCM